MDRLLDIASRHNLVVLEDCAHALGATYKGRPVGTFGTGALFSFQTLKPLNCYGGGIALVQDAGVAAKVRQIVDALPWPSEKRVRDRLLMGRLQRIFMKPWVFSISLFPGAVGVRADRRQPGRVLLGEDSLAAPAAGSVHRAVSERAGARSDSRR